MLSSDWLLVTKMPQAVLVAVHKVINDMRAFYEDL